MSQWHMGGEGQRLFGSDLLHNTGMTLKVCRAHQVRGLSGDRHHTEQHLIEVNLSLAQWARLVSAVGNSSGIPVTLSYYNEGTFVDVPHIAAPALSKREAHGEVIATELRKKLEEMKVLVQRLGAALDGPGGKKELRAVHRDLEREVAQLPRNTQFVYDQFSRATEKVAEDAKIEVESYVNMMANHLGMDQLR